MRHGRQKQARKTLQFFRLAQGIAPPYHVILDGTFLMAMIEQNVPVRERLDRTLQHGEFSLYVTRSSLDELQKLAQHKSPKQELFQHAWRWGLDECDKILEKNDMPAGDLDKTFSSELSQPGKDLVSLVAAKPQYFVCSQDETLLDLLRSMGTAPLMRISRGVFLMENPSKSSQHKKKNEEGAKWSVAGSLQDQEKNLVTLVKENQRREREKSHQHSQRYEQQQRRKGKAKGPNPLSCKKKKREESKPQLEEVDKKKKRRRREKQSV